MGNIAQGFRLTRIFHTDLLRRPGSKSDPALDSHCDLGGMETYSPRSNSKLTQYPSGVRKPQQNQYEISGLAPKRKNKIS